jgi:hypothetical protein
LIIQIVHKEGEAPGKSGAFSFGHYIREVNLLCYCVSKLIFDSLSLLIEKGGQMGDNIRVQDNIVFA